MTEKENIPFMKEAVRLSIENVEQGIGGPFGAVVVKCLGRSIADITKTLHDDPRMLHGEPDTFRRFRRRHKLAASGGVTST